IVRSEGRRHLRLRCGHRPERAAAGGQGTGRVTTMSTPQPTFRVVLPSVPGGGPVEVGLRSLLKAALRAFGFRRVKVEELASRPRRRSRRVPPDREEKFMAECVNLLELFGEKYRITWDEAYDAKGKHRATIDVWYAQIPCR